MSLGNSGFSSSSLILSSVSMQPQHCIGDQRTRSLHGYWYCPLFLSDVKARTAGREREREADKVYVNLQHAQNQTRTSKGFFMQAGRQATTRTDGTGQMPLAHARASHRLHMSHSDAPVWPHAAGHHWRGWGLLNKTLWGENIYIYIERGI